MRNGYQNLTAAAEALKFNLRRITGGHDITIDSMDEHGATWHSDNISAKLEGCPEEDIKQLLATIKIADTEDYTRRFKMYLTEHFSFPKVVTVEWLGPCLSASRKRSQPELVTSTSVEQPSTTEITTDSLIPSTTTEPPTTTTTSASEITTVKDSFVNEPLTLSPTFDSFPDFFSTEMPETTTSPPTTTIATTVAETQATTTMIPITTTTITVTELPSTRPPEIAEQPSSSPVDSTETLSTTEPQSTTSTETMTTMEIELESLSIDANEVKSPQLANTEPHYGKYIGLTAGFLIFVAYLICSRSYKRHGMYELQT